MASEIKRTNPNDQNQSIARQNVGRENENLPARQQRGDVFRDPFRLMREMLRDPFGTMTPFFGEQMWSPQFEVRETGDTFLFKADVPGVKQDDIDIQLHGNRLEISGRRDQEEEHKEGDQVYAYERSYGSFRRAFTLPENADLEHVRCDLKDGVLTLAVPKKAGQQPRRIQIGGGGSKS
ncbi:MAG TPA: HSP20 family small heat-shock protein [Kofleriaceae bacterium]|nr:HSP20 family small heat-shock protein [Kofleriaceae bacterium]